jgi:hypothetical protein
MSVTIASRPKANQGKRFDPELRRNLPYEDRIILFCGHSPFYIYQFIVEQPPFCGLCFFREGYQSEIPTRIHQFKTLATNGNPETTPKMVSHLHVVMGLIPPKPGENLQAYRKRRTSLAREQYTTRSPLPDHKLVKQTRQEPFSRPAVGLFPVTSALWKLMGYQPPLGRVLIEGVNGRTEYEIADKLDSSVLDIHLRMAKAIRVGMGFIPNDSETRSSTSTRRRRSGGSEEAGSDESGIGDSESTG